MSRVWPIAVFALGATMGHFAVSRAHVSVLWSIAFGLGFFLFAALVNILVRFVLVKIFGTPEAGRAFVRERARKISRRFS